MYVLKRIILFLTKQKAFCVAPLAVHGAESASSFRITLPSDIHNERIRAEGSVHSVNKPIPYVVKNL